MSRIVINCITRFGFMKNLINPKEQELKKRKSYI